MVKNMTPSTIRTIILAMLLFCGEWSHGQITIQNATLNGDMVSPSTLFQLVVTNTGPTAIVRFDGHVRTRQGEQVILFQTSDHTLPSGTSTLTSSSLAMRSFNYGTGEAGRNARVHQRLVGGQHSWCIQVISNQAETNDEWCDELYMEDLLYLDLVMPWNGDSIDEVRPALTWTISGSPVAISTAHVRITLVPMPKHMNAAQALAAEIPLFNMNDVTQRTLFYPPGVSDLKRGQCYAWQAERIVDGRVADRSDPWSFCVKEHPRPKADKYVLLDRIEPGRVYEAVDQRIYFRYDEPYAASNLTCVILGPDRRQLEPDTKKEGADKAIFGTKSVGVNLYELDLSTYGLKPGIHTLRVLDGKERQYELLFNISR